MRPKLLNCVDTWCRCGVQVTVEVHCVGESDCFQKKSAEVRMPSVQGGLEARSSMRLA